MTSLSFRRESGATCIRQRGTRGGRGLFFAVRLKCGWAAWTRSVLEWEGKIFSDSGWFLVCTLYALLVHAIRPVILGTWSTRALCVASLYITAKLESTPQARYRRKDNAHPLLFVGTSYGWDRVGWGCLVSGYSFSSSQFGLGAHRHGRHTCPILKVLLLPLSSARTYTHSSIFRFAHSASNVGGRGCTSSGPNFKHQL